MGKGKLDSDFTFLQTNLVKASEKIKGLETKLKTKKEAWKVVDGTLTSAYDRCLVNFI